GTTNLVQGSQHSCRRHGLTVDGNDVTFFVGQFQVGRLVRSVFRGNRPQPHIFLRLCSRILQQVTLVGNVQQVGVHGVRRLLAAFFLNRNVVGFTVSHQLVTGSQIPLTPRSNNTDTRFQCVGTQFKTHL